MTDAIRWMDERLSTMIFKASWPLVVILGIYLGFVELPNLDYSTIVNVVLLICGMIGTAYVMRHDVADLKKWKEAHDDNTKEWQDKHEETHEKIVSILSKLEESKRQVERRLESLEDEERQKNRYRERHGREL